MIRVFVAIAILFAAVFALDWLGGVPEANPAVKQARRA